jgi:hypothetical protein
LRQLNHKLPRKRLEKLLRSKKLNRQLRRKWSRQQLRRKQMNLMLMRLYWWQMVQKMKGQEVTLLIQEGGHHGLGAP